MSRYIDANKIRLPSDSLLDENGDALVSVRDVRNALAQTPTAEVVEVVRCKDGKHHPDNGGECDRSITHTGRDYVCECNTYRYIGLDYCSYGERREG